MKPGHRFRRLRMWVSVRRMVRGFLLLALCAIVWSVTIYVCGRQAMLIKPEAAQAIMRQVLPGIW